MSERPDKLVEALRSALRDNERLRRAAAEAASPVSPAAPASPAPEPIAVIGAACRFSGGVSSPEQLWRLVDTGTDTVGPPPPERTGSATVLGAFLDEPGAFDAGFFGISPREALAMDPQQRLVLECSWEALERAGIDPLGLARSDTGVFVGSSMQDYGGNTFGAAELEGLLATGNAAAVLSGRVSYVLGLEGPALTVDTACSSSLVTLHLARQSLLRGECSLAMAGGATVMATDLMFAEFGRQGGLAPDGRCKAFGDGADGTGWGEGAGMLVLEKLSDARRLGHPVLAVVRGSAVNSDGASNGLTAPNGPSQQRVIRAALADAGLTAAEVDVVEAHGTGTELGDPIEAQALLATYGQDRATPLLLGSVKSNIGHTQAAAGVAGVLKMIEALRHRRVPPTLHAQRPSTRVDWRAGAVELASGQPWPHAGRPGRAGVSSFGVSGTNAHVILEEAAPAPDPGAPPSAPVAAPVAVAWPLSARGAGGLRRQAARLAPEVAGLHPADVGHTLSTRAGLEERAVLVGADATELTEALVVLATEEPGPDVVLGTARPGGPGRTVFVFPGQGAQWTGMGRALYDESPVFAEALRDCAAALAKYVDWDLLEVLADEQALRGVDVVQPASWAVMVALARLWQSHGVTPAAVLGHSQGEIAAACVAGVLDLASGAKVVVSRARLIARSLSGHGAMASVAEPAQRVRERLAGRGGDREVSVAAVNGPAATTVSGPAARLRALVDECVAEDVRAKLLPVDYASHSAQVDALRTDLLAELADLAPEPGGPAFFSTVTGEVLDGTQLDAEYWYRNLREPVGFAPAVQALAGRGYGCFLEVSTHPVLLAGTSDTLTEAGAAHAVATGTLRRDDGGLSRFLRSLGEAWAHGVVVDWAPAFGPARRVELPTYAFDHRHYWATPPAPETGPAPGAAFWAAVERTDPVALSGLLDTDQDAVAGLLPALSTWWQAERAASGGAPGWRYRVHWRPVDVPRAPAPAALLVVLPEQPEPGARAVLAALRTVAEVRTVTVPTDIDRAALSAQLSSGDTRCTAGAVVSLLAGAPGWATPGVAHAWRLTRLLVQALGDLESDLPLWCLTTEAAGPEAAAESRSDSTGPDSTGPDSTRSDSTGPGGAARPEQTALWALGLVAGLERPHQKVALADLPAEPDEDCVRTLLGLLCATSPEDQVVLRGRRVLGRRIVRANARPVPAEGGNARRPGDGAVLVTGGTGGLGALLARRLARRGETDIVLAGRRGVLPDGLELPGVRAVVCDVTDADSVAALRAELLAEDTRVRAVYHLAGVVSGVPIESSDDAEWAAVCGPKVAGVRHLEQVFGADAGEFVLFSSNAGVWGSAGQAAYATANRYLDAFAAARRRAGRHALAIAWGAWGEVGMAAGPAGTDLTRLGLKPMAPEAALDVLEQALDTDETTLSVADVDWPRFAGAYAAARARPLLDGIPEAVVDEPAAAHDQAAALHGELATLTHTEQHELLRQLVTVKAGAILGYRRGETLDPAKAFRDLGFDSLTAVELRNSLVRGSGVTLPTTVVFDHPNATALAEHLHRLLVGGTGPETLHADLDRLERSMADLDTTPDVLNQLALRLRRIAHTLVTEPATEPGDNTVTDVDTADPDELLAIIQGEFKS